MPTIIVNGVRLAYDEAGAGPPVIWVHGGFTDRHGADLVVPLLSARYRLITYDRRGHSKSERLPGRQGVTDHVADLVALIEQLDAAPAHLLANSDGGEIAIKVAARRPQLVASLCIHEPSLYWILPDDGEFKAVREHIRGWLHPVVAELERGDYEAAARLMMEGVALGPGSWDALPEQTRRTFVHNAPTWLDTARDPSYGFLGTGELGRVSMPVLLTGGDQSDPGDLAIVGRLAAALPHARRHTFADAGHVPHRTHPEEYGRVMLSFLDKITAKAAP
jgi:pimeloyl-ACP methyl ester carboxylesterase